MFNYSSPSVKNSALLAVASIPHKLAGRPIFGIWCRAVLLFLLSSVGLLALPRSSANTRWHAHSQTDMHSELQIHKQTAMMQYISQLCSFPLRCWPFVDKLIATGYKVFNNSAVCCAAAKSPQFVTGPLW